MNRRNLLKNMLGLSSGALGLMPSIQAKTLMLQQSPVAGFQYYAGEQLWPLLKPGQSLRLQREAENPNDRRAVALYWQQEKIGYLPRIDNAAVSQLMDNGQPLQATIQQLTESNNPWQRMQINIYLE